MTGVQTCALPILLLYRQEKYYDRREKIMEIMFWLALVVFFVVLEIATVGLTSIWLAGGSLAGLICAAFGMGRSEERRVGKECRSRWSPYH